MTSLITGSIWLKRKWFVVVLKLFKFLYQGLGQQFRPGTHNLPKLDKSRPEFLYCQPDPHIYR